MRNMGAGMDAGRRARAVGQRRGPASNRTLTVGATAVALVLAAAGGSVATGYRSATPNLASSHPLPPNEDPGVRIPPGQIAAAIARVDGLSKDLMRKTGIPGMAVAVVRGDKTVFLKGYGVRKVGSPAKVNPDTVFQLASMSKPVGSTVVAHEVTKGTVGWDTPVRRDLPWFTLKDPWVGRHVTVGDMYAHRSGLPDHVGDDLEDLGYTRTQILHKLRQAPLAPFRATYAYTNFGLTAAAQSVAAAAGKGWATLSHDVLYRPLGMTSTSSRFRDYVARPNRAWTHVKIDGKYVAKYTQDADAQSPAGGVSSSVRDLSHWLSMLLADGSYRGRRIASADALLQAWTPQSVFSPPANARSRTGSSGYGFDLLTKPSGRTTMSYSGAFVTGADTNFVMMPSANVAIVALSNGFPNGTPETLTAEFMDLVQFGHLTQDWFTLYKRAFDGLGQPFGSLAGKERPPHPRPPLPARSYTGTYTSSYYGPLRVVQRAGSLRLVLGPNHTRYALRPWNGNTFVFTPRGANANAGSVSKATFRVGRNRHATSVDLEWFDQEGLGTFHRRR